MTNTHSFRQAATLLRAGYLLFLLGLLTGFAIPAMANPRMGLASHLEGVLNGVFLVALAFTWTNLALGSRGKKIAFSLAMYGTFANWAATLLAAVWGAGRSMPIASGGRVGVPAQELAIDFLLYSLSFAMVILVGMVIWGLRGVRLFSQQEQA